MLKKFKKQINNEKGLTLIEVLAVIVILAIVAAIAIPAIGNIITNSKVNALKADAQNVLSAASLYFVDNNTSDGGDVTVTTLNTGGYLDNAGGFASATVVKAKTGNTISGTAGTGTPNIVFLNTTNANITASTKDTGTNMTINR